MNILAFLTILFGTAAILLAYALLAARNEAAGWRVHAHIVTEQGMEIVAHCEALETRNEWLASQWTHCRDVVALSMAQSRYARSDRMKMEVAEMREMP